MVELKACYDRRLSKIVSIVQEILGVKTKPIQFITKILPIMDHFTSTDFGASKEFYGGRGETLTGAGQGNLMSVKMCIHSSCIILKDI